MARPTMAHVMMNMADLIATRSTCSRLQVGVVVATLDLTNVVAIGYNGNARGLPNGCETPDAPGRCGCLHAEDNALVKAPADRGGLWLFTTHSPCPTCAKRILNSAVRKVSYRRVYGDNLGVAILRGQGVAVDHIARSVDQVLASDESPTRVY
jgi:dCMP deaminase